MVAGCKISNIDSAADSNSNLLSFSSNGMQPIREITDTPTAGQYAAANQYFASSNNFALDGGTQMNKNCHFVCFDLAGPSRAVEAMVCSARIRKRWLRCLFVCACVCVNACLVVRLCVCACARARAFAVRESGWARSETVVAKHARMGRGQGIKWTCRQTGANEG